MTLELGAPFEFVWRNDELTDPPGERPESMGAEHRMQSHITESIRRGCLAFAWHGGGDVTIELEPRGARRSSPSPTAASRTARRCSASAPAGTSTSTSSRRACGAEPRPSGTAGGASAPNTSAASPPDA